MAPNISNSSFFADLDRVRLAPDAADSVVMEVAPPVQARKARSNEYVRTHPANTLVTSVFIEKPTNDVWLVAPEARECMAAEMKVMALTHARTRQGVDIVVPVPVGTNDGRSNLWQDTLREAMARARTKWVRMLADMNIGAYRIFEAQGDLGEPKWSDTPFNQLLEAAFKGRVIDTEDHPIVRRLRGLE